MIQVGLSVRMQACPLATDSSPMKLQRRRGKSLTRKSWQREFGPCGRVSPVRPLSEFLLQGADDELLHPLVGLGDQIHGRALGLDLDLALSGISDLLNESRWEQNVQGNPLPSWNPGFTHLSGASCHLDCEVVGLLPGIFHFLYRLGANWENVRKETNRKKQAEGVRAPTSSELFQKTGLRNGCTSHHRTSSCHHYEGKPPGWVWCTLQTGPRTSRVGKNLPKIKYRV